jgi:integrase
MLISQLKTSLGFLPFTRKGQEPRKGDLTVDDIEQFLLLRQSEVIADHKTCAESYLDIYVVTLKAAFHHCKIECQAIEDLEHRKIKKQKKESIPDSALSAFHESLPRSVLAVMLYKEMVPCRCLELYDLEVSQVNLVDRKILLRADQTKTDEARDLPIPAALMDYFTWIVSSGSPWVFPRIEVRAKTGELVFHKMLANYVAVHWRAVRRDNNLPENIKFRLLRHSTVSRYLQQGIDGGIVADIMGASQETMRTFYQVVPIEVKNNAADQVIYGHPLDTLNKILPFRGKSEVVSA